MEFKEAEEDLISRSLTSFIPSLKSSTAMDVDDDESCSVKACAFIGQLKHVLHASYMDLPSKEHISGECALTKWSFNGLPYAC